MTNFVWIPDKDYEWILAEVLETRGENITALLTSTSRKIAKGDTSFITPEKTQSSAHFLTGFDITSPFRFQSNMNAIFEIIPSVKVVVSKKQTAKFDSSHLQDLDDLKDMHHIHEGPIIHILRRRWLNGMIYTNVGDVLIVVNPIKPLPDLHSNPLEYYDSSIKYPHIYTIANRALKSLFKSSKEVIFGYSPPLKNQSIVISGESGSGKSEATRNILQYLTTVNYFKLSGKDKSKKIVKDALLQSCVVLEAFGHAQTTQNMNSSRFGKFIKLKYNSCEELTSVSIEAFLLEKSRLSNVNKGERNFHIFYQLLRGIRKLNPSVKTRLDLSEVENFKLLNSGDISNKPADVPGLLHLYNAMISIGVSQEDIISLWEILAAILHLGNIEFSQNENSVNNPVSMVATTSSLLKISQILGVSSDDLQRALISRSLDGRNSLFRKGSRKSIVAYVTKEDAYNNVEGLIRRLYQTVFAWLLNAINSYHENLILDDNFENFKFVGILDACGFESLDVNSLEQLAINLTSERLHQQFNEKVFDIEQDLYMQGDINWSPIYYQDNVPTIDLLCKKPIGILNILEEHCIKNRGIDEMAILNQYHQIHGNNPDRVYSKPRVLSDPTFTVRHHAGTLTYQISGFLQKNIDSVSDLITDLLQSSSSKFLLHMIACSVREVHDSSVEDRPSPISSPHTIYGKHRKTLSNSNGVATASSSIRHQLDSLISALNTMDSHYVKCFRPNDQKSEKIFQTSLVKKQLRDNDITALTSMEKLKFKCHYKFIHFYRRYEILLRLLPITRASAKLCIDEAEAKRFCMTITDKYFTPDQYAYGRHHLFIRGQAHDHLEKTALEYAESFALKIQAVARQYLNSKSYIRYSDTDIGRSAMSRIQEDQENPLLSNTNGSHHHHDTRIIDDSYSVYDDDLSSENISVNRSLEESFEESLDDPSSLENENDNHAYSRIKREKNLSKEVEQRRLEDIKRRSEQKRNSFEEDMLRRRIAEEAFRMQAVYRNEILRSGVESNNTNTHFEGNVNNQTKSSLMHETYLVDDSTSFRRTLSSSQAQRPISGWTSFVNQIDDIALGFGSPNEWVQPVEQWVSKFWT